MDQPQTSFMQKILDNIWLLFALGLLIYFVSYIMWGWYQIGNVPDLPPEIKQQLTR